MVTETDQVKALQKAILDRAHQLSDEHIQQGKMTRNKIMQDTREKIKLMEQKELLAAKLNADREYQRLVQASELRIQAELDRNRWGLVQSVVHHMVQELDRQHKDRKRYPVIFRNLLRQGVAAMGPCAVTAFINSDDLSQFSKTWDSLVVECCGTNKKISLSGEACICSGGLKLVSDDGDVMIDNTFEGIIGRRDEELKRRIFERLFSTVSPMGAVYNG
ncbi:MAG: V-type ATP synthase subunit E [Gammaproteobacteria bacterium]|nr:V-type ATP synthase subunit E [Gammaproteobacteria bacterium]